MIKTKTRIQFIDIAKGIAIFLVVWGHTASNQELQSFDCNIVSKMLYSFHMPLFFFLSGLSMSSDPIRTWSQWRSFLKKIILTIAFPYLIWSLIYSTFSYENLSWILYGSWQALGKASSLTSMWFLSCLFISKIVAELIISFTGQKLWIPIALVLLVVGRWLPEISIGYPWCLDIALVAASFIILGVVVKNPCIKLGVQRISLLFVLSLISAVIFAVSVIYGRDTFTVMMMCKGAYGTGLWPFVRVITGSFSVLTLSMAIRQLSEYITHDMAIKVLIYIGQCTIGIFILHKPFLQEVMQPLVTSLTGDFLSAGMIRFVSAVIVMTLTIPVCGIIIHYVPELVGVFSKDRLRLRRDDN